MTGAALAVSLAVWSSTGCRAEPDAVEVLDQGEPEVARTVATAPDDAWVSVSGRVIDTGADSFDLDYGGGTIRVELDAADWFPGGTGLLDNDDVVVYGTIDKGFYEERKIQARSVYVEDLGTAFYAADAHEGLFPAFGTTDARPRIEVRGTVESVTGDEFHLDTGVGVIEVETEEMAYDPLDEEGFQRIVPGDRVVVTGRLEPDLFTEMDLVADTIVSLRRRAEPQKSGS